MQKFFRVISLILVLAMTISLCACSKLTGGNSSADIEVQYTTEYIGDENNTVADNSSSTQTANSSVDNTAVQNNESQNNTSSDTSSQNTSSVTSNTSSKTPSSSQESNSNQSQNPEVTICAAVATNTYVIGGVCPLDTEYIRVGGTNATETKIIPAKGESNNYFIGEIKISGNANLEVQCKQSGKELSKIVSLYAHYNTGQKNLQTINDYKPFFGSDSRMHFYSALLSYSLSNVIDNDMKAYAKYNINEVVSLAKSMGAEVIYLVVPSSAAVYPETVPSEFKAASGETIYEAFSTIATQCGAKVIYPLDTMKSHKNDGDGYKIYSNTDSHWTTYGAYWGVAELMNYIGSKYPTAKPRSVDYMQFYTAELYGGDALFSFDDNNGFENLSDASKNGGATVNTKINELTTLYSRAMPTSTLNQITRGKKSLYLTKDNEGAYSFTNSNGAGLPSAVIVRDSFGRTAFDMVNDRFSNVWWLSEGDYTSVIGETASRSPNYVIYIVSERNLIKVMLGDKDVSLKHQFT